MQRNEGIDFNELTNVYGRKAVRRGLDNLLNDMTAEQQEYHPRKGRQPSPTEVERAEWNDRAGYADRFEML